MEDRGRKKPPGLAMDSEDDFCPSSEQERKAAGFDFLLYQKKAGLQDVADQAAKEVEADDQGDDFGDDYVQQAPAFSGPKYNTFMLTYFKELDEIVKEEERLMSNSRTPCNPCGAEYDERMRQRMLDMYRSHVHPLEVNTNFGSLYDEPMDLGDFERMALVAVIAPKQINKQNFISGLTGSLAFDFSTVPKDEFCDREEGGFDFLLYQKKAGLQDIADQAAKDVEKKEEASAAVEEGGGMRRRKKAVDKPPDRFDYGWVFCLSRDRCSPYARRVGGADAPIEVDSRTTLNAARSYSRQTVRSERTEANERQAAGFDFLLYQKKAGLQDVADQAAKEVEEKAGQDDGGYEDFGEEELAEGGDQAEEGYFVSGREILRMSPRIVNLQPIVMKFGYRFITEHILGYMMDTPVLQRFNVISFPDVVEGDFPAVPDREVAGFDFLLFQKKAGLQDAAEAAEQEAKKDDEAPQQYVQQGGGTKRRKRQRAPDKFDVSTYVSVGRYFCQKADRILVVIDARRDLWRHFVMMLESIQAYGGKVSMCYMYPLDQGTGYIMRRYSDQLWNFSKIFRPLAEPVRYYGNAFRDQGAFKTCWFYTDEDLGKDMFHLHKFTGCRIAYELQQRAMLAAILAIIFNHLKDLMPKIRVPFKLPKCIKLNIPGFSDAITIPIFNRTEQARREALYSLDYHFFQLQDKERLPPDMFPCEELFLDLLVYKDFSKLDYIDKKLVENCRRIAEDDMIRVVGRYLEQCPADQLDFDPRSTLCGGKMYEPVVDKAERVQFESAFDAMRPDVDDKIDTESFVESLWGIPMPPGSLGRIAVMADHDRDCRLSREEFIAGMHMALLKMNGLELPIRAPHRYFAGSMRHPYTPVYFRRMTEIGEEVIPGAESEWEEEDLWEETFGGGPADVAKEGEAKKDAGAAAGGDAGGGGFFDSIWYQKKAGLQAQNASQQEDMWAAFFTPVEAGGKKGKGGKGGKAPPPPPETFGAFMAFYKPLKGKKKFRDVQIQESYLQPGGVKMTGSFHIFHVL